MTRLQVKDTTLLDFYDGEFVKITKHDQAKKFFKYSHTLSVGFIQGRHRAIKLAG
jgi:hypothetical protein